ncbi:hypothetical protein GCM10023088_00290 [Actinomadura verrucosospora]|uniref:hypothetical protein n=1 Tax=Actinomadura TaxID=1988 RepID=UPI0031F094FA
MAEASARTDLLYPRKENPWGARMKTALRRTVLSLSALTVTTVGTLSLMSPANAAAAYSVPGVCGSGYKEVRSIALSGYNKTADGWGTVAYVKIGYNAGNGKNCAFTQKSTTNYSYGKLSEVSVKLRELRYGDTSYDVNGPYRYFAGPVYVSARNTCINVWGWEDWAGSYDFGPIACG